MLELMIKQMKNVSLSNVLNSFDMENEIAFTIEENKDTFTLPPWFQP